MKGIGKPLWQMLILRNITTAQLAPQLGLKTNQVTGITRNRSSTSLENLKIMSEVLDVPTDYLLKEFDKKFLIYAIDDYLSLLGKDKAKEALTSVLQIFEE